LGFIHGGSALMAAGRLEEAIELLSNAAGQFASNIDVRITLGWALNRSKKWREAEPLWRALATEFPERDQIWVGLAETLNALRQFEEARVWIDKARLKRPIDAYSTVLEARIAIGQGRWSEAVAKLTEAQVHFPNDVGIRMTLNEAQMRSLLEAPEAALPVEGTDAATAPGDGDSRLREIFMQFESLGSTCEFGLVQRNFGAEPLGLLRWSVISYKQLMTGLSNRFEGVGLPENTRMKVVRREWYTEDLTYGMGMHTFILENEEPEETLFPKLCKRLQFLRRKLVDDLQCDDKIFVYKSEERLTDTKILALHKEICRDGEKMVLVVVLADNDHQVGTIREIRQGLIVGYIKTFFDPKPVIDPWLRICLSTHAMWQARHAYQSVNRAN
jgi:tetratricopeptide (TPR) repeat protein